MLRLLPIGVRITAVLRTCSLIGLTTFSLFLSACSDNSPSVEQPDTDGWLTEPSNYSWQESTFHPAIDWDRYSPADIAKTTSITVGTRRVEAWLAPYTRAAGNRWIKPLLEGAKVSCINVRTSQRVIFYDSLGNVMWVVKAACDNEKVYSLQPQIQKSAEVDLRLLANWRIAPWNDRILTN